MKKIDRKTAIALSLFCALLTACIWNVSVNRRVANARPADAVRTVSVATAARDIKPRDVLRPEMIRFMQVPADEMPEGAVGLGNDPFGKVAQQMIPQGTVLTARMLEDRGPSLGLAFNLPENMRAVAVPLDPVSGVAGFLKPGDHVDVLATYSGNGNDITRTVLQDILLLAIGSTPINTTQYQGSNSPAVNGGQDPNKAQTDAPTATLAVWPEQAQALVLTAAKARIHLALRPVDDAAPTPLKPISTVNVFGPGSVQRPAATPAPPAPPAAPIIRETAPPAPAAYVPLPAPAPSPAPAPKPASEKKETAITVIRAEQQSHVVVPTQDTETK